MKVDVRPINLDPSIEYWQAIHKVTKEVIFSQLPELRRANQDRIHIRFRNVSSNYELMITDGKPAPHNLYLNIGLEARLPIYGMAWGDHPRWYIYTSRPEKWKMHVTNQLDPMLLQDPVFMREVIEETKR